MVSAVAELLSVIGLKQRVRSELDVTFCVDPPCNMVMYIPTRLVEAAIDHFCQ